MNVDFVNEVTNKAGRIFADARERDEKNSLPGVNGISLQAEYPAPIAENSDSKPVKPAKSPKG
jgi:hypothetical protein